MGKINLLPRKEFEITLDDNTVVAGQFNTWSTARFCEKQKYTLATMHTALNENLRMSDIFEFLLAAVEYKIRKAKKPFGFTEIDCAEWIDQIGGMNGSQFAELFNHAKDAAPVEEDGEKKTEEST